MEGEQGTLHRRRPTAPDGMVDISGVARFDDRVSPSLEEEGHERRVTVA